MSTKFQAFLTEKKIDPRRVIAASHDLERLRPEDRAIRLAKRVARKSEDAEKRKKEGLAAQKPRSGRPVTDRAIAAAMSGKTLSGPSKNRILKAVNHILGQRKQEPVDLRALFDMPRKASLEAS